jgi:hypothetical protein
MYQYLFCPGKPLGRRAEQHGHCQCQYSGLSAPFPECSCTPSQWRPRSVRLDPVKEPPLRGEWECGACCTLPALDLPRPSPTPPSASSTKQTHIDQRPRERPTPPSHQPAPPDLPSHQSLVLSATHEPTRTGQDRQKLGWSFVVSLVVFFSPFFLSFPFFSCLIEPLPCSARPCPSLSSPSLSHATQRTRVTSPSPTLPSTVLPTIFSIGFDIPGSTS